MYSDGRFRALALVYNADASKFEMVDAMSAFLSIKNGFESGIWWSR